MQIARSRQFETFCFQNDEPAPGWKRQFSTGLFGSTDRNTRDLFRYFIFKKKRQANLRLQVGLAFLKNFTLRKSTLRLSRRFYDLDEQTAYKEKFLIYSPVIFEIIKMEAFVR
jgi:hypothetical protein